MLKKRFLAGLLSVCLAVQPAVVSFAEGNYGAEVESRDAEEAGSAAVVTAASAGKATASNAFAEEETEEPADDEDGELFNDLATASDAQAEDETEELTEEPDQDLTDDLATPSDAEKPEWPEPELAAYDIYPQEDSDLLEEDLDRDGKKIYGKLEEYLEKTEESGELTLRIELGEAGTFRGESDADEAGLEDLLASAEEQAAELDAGFRVSVQDAVDVFWQKYGGCLWMDHVTVLPETELLSAEEADGKVSCEWKLSYVLGIPVNVDLDEFSELLEQLREFMSTTYQGTIAVTSYVYLYPGETYQMEPEFTGYSGTPTPQYSVQDETVATVTSKGLVTGVKNGSTYVVVTLSDGNSAKTRVTVYKITEASDLKVTANYNQYVKLTWTCGYNYENVYRREGSGSWTLLEELSYTDRGSYLDTTAKSGHTYEYRISARRNHNDQTIISEGTTLKVTVSGKKVSLTQDAATIAVGATGSVPIRWSGFDSEPAFRYSSSDTGVVKVSSDGTVTGVASGVAAVTVSLSDGLSLTCDYICLDESTELCTDREWEVLKITNENRIAEGKWPLSMLPVMQEATDIRKVELLSLFSHTRPDGSDWDTALDEVGCSYISAAENIASGQTTPAAAMNAWMNSSGHYKNIMGSYVHIGVGETKNHWVQMFVGCSNVDTLIIGDGQPKAVTKGTTIEAMDETVELVCSSHGVSFMPLLESMCSGYDPNKVGEQKVTVTYRDETITWKVYVVSGAVKTTGDRTQLEAFVTRLYENFLDREPDEDGLDSWVNKLLFGLETGASITGKFALSTEFTNKDYGDEDFVRIMYRAMFDRTADTTGLNYWVDCLDSGVSRGFIVWGFAKSGEFSKLCSSYGITQGTYTRTQNRDQNLELTKFVNRCYKEALSRKGEEEGLNAWTGRILSGQKTPQETALYFVTSKELTAKNLSNTEYVKTLYRLYMGREAETAGLKNWVSQLNKGTYTLATLAARFGNSKEFKAIVASYGL